MKVAALILALMACFAVTADARYFGGFRAPRFYGRMYRYSYRPGWYGYYGRRLLQDAATEGSSGDDSGQMDEASGGEADASAPPDSTSSDSSSSGSSDSKDCKSFKEVLMSNPDLSSFAEAAKKNLPKDAIEKLSDKDTQGTLFVPNNQAVKTLLDFTGEKTDEIFNNETVTALLSYHALPSQTYEAADLTDGKKLKTALGDTPLKVKVKEGKVLIYGVGSEAEVVDSDIKTCNGVVHVIDTVLLPVDGDGEFDEEQKKFMEEHHGGKSAAGGSEDSGSDSDGSS